MSGWVRAQLGCDLQSLVAVRGGHADVGHHDVGLLGLDRRAQRPAVAAGGDELDAVGVREHVAERLADEVAVVGDHDADRRRLPDSSPWPGSRRSCRELFSAHRCASTDRGSSCGHGVDGVERALAAERDANSV